MIYHAVSKKNMLLRCFILTLCFVSMHSVWAVTVFKRVATDTSPDDKKKTKRRIPRKSVYIHEFQEIDVSPEDKKEWDDLVDKIEKKLKSLFTLERKGVARIKIGLAKKSYKDSLDVAKRLFTEKISNKITEKRKEEKEAYKKFYESVVKVDPDASKKLKLEGLKKFVEISEFGEVEVDSADKERWDDIASKIKKKLKEFRKLRRKLSNFKRDHSEYVITGDEMIDRIVEYHLLFKDAKNLFAKILKKILLNMGFEKAAVTDYKGWKITKTFDNIAGLKVMDLDFVLTYKGPWNFICGAVKTLAGRCKHMEDMASKPYGSGFWADFEDLKREHIKELQKAKNLFSDMLKE